MRREAAGWPGRSDRGARSVRSSAACEDSEDSSFAGQFDTILNVSPGDCLQAWKRVVASAWNPRAVFYHRTKGYRDQDVLMAVLVVGMIVRQGRRVQPIPASPPARRTTSCWSAPPGDWA